jgi:hypothetical protein
VRRTATITAGPDAPRTRDLRRADREISAVVTNPDPRPLSLGLGLIPSMVLFDRGGKVIGGGSLAIFYGLHGLSDRAAGRGFASGFRAACRRSGSGAPRRAAPRARLPSPGRARLTAGLRVTIAAWSGTSTWCASETTKTTSRSGASTSTRSRSASSGGVERHGSERLGCCRLQRAVLAPRVTGQRIREARDARCGSLGRLRRADDSRRAVRLRAGAERAVRSAERVRLSSPCATSVSTRSSRSSVMSK